MARTRSPLPSYGLGVSVASDWLPGDVSEDVTWQQGKWWTVMHWRTRGRDLERDRERLRRNKAVGAFLRTQSADPGL